MSYCCSPGWYASPDCTLGAWRSQHSLACTRCASNRSPGSLEPQSIDVLSAFWLLVVLLAYERYAARPAAGWFLAACAAFALGLLSKSMLVTLPLLLLLIDVWPLERWQGATHSETAVRRYPQRSARELLFEKLPLFVISLLDGIVTIYAQGTGSAFTSTAGVPWFLRFGNALLSYGWYIARTVWPTQLSVYYPHPLHDLSWGWVTAAAMLLAAISAHVAWNGVRRPHLWVGWLWFLIALLPVIGLMQVGLQAHADRYSYIPHVGLLLLDHLGKPSLAEPLANGSQAAAQVAAAVSTGGMCLVGPRRR